MSSLITVQEAQEVSMTDEGHEPESFPDRVTFFSQLFIRNKIKCILFKELLIILIYVHI